MKFRLVLAISPLLFLAACSDKYRLYEKQYSFRSASGLPDYANLDYWAAHPQKKDPSDSVPAPLRNEPRDSSVDVFFIHPTTFTKKRDKQVPNARIDDPYLNAKTDYTAILYQASVFNRSARIFAPRYRQAHIHNFFSGDSLRSKPAFEKAYADVRAAFLYYLEHWNGDRPLIIAAHSQGSFHALRLLKEFFENKPLAQKLVVAYVAGWPLPKTYSASLPACRDSTQTGCICSWRTFRNGYTPGYLKKEKDFAQATNPLNWTTGNDYANKKENRGSVLLKFNKVFPHTTGARLQNGMLFVSKPRFPWGFLYFTCNYHIADINLFYMNIRDNIRTRIARFNR